MEYLVNIDIKRNHYIIINFYLSWLLSSVIKKYVKRNTFKQKLFRILHHVLPHWRLACWPLHTTIYHIGGQDADHYTPRSTTLEVSMLTITHHDLPLVVCNGQHASLQCGRSWCVMVIMLAFSVVDRGV
jgi:hypothetical protein